MASRSRSSDSQIVEGPDHAAPIVAVSEQTRFQMRIALAKVGDYWAVVA